MTDFRFILNKLGIVQAVYQFDNAPVDSTPSLFPTIQGKETQYMTTGRRTELMTTYLGTPVFADIILSNQAEDRKIQLIASVVEVSQSKIIERTTVRGRNGTVKEYWSMDDYSVRIRGALIDPRPDYYPKEVVETLQLLIAESESLKVVSERGLRGETRESGGAPGAAGGLGRADHSGALHRPGSMARGG